MHRTILIGCALAAALVVTACGGSSSTPPTNTPASSPPATAPQPTATAAPSATSTPVTPAATPVLAACVPAQVGLQAIAQGATGNIAIGVTVTSVGKSCHLAGTLSVTVEDANGNPLVVTGNGASVPFEANISLQPVSRVFFWSNWCGAQGSFKAEVKLDGHTILIPIAVPAPCDQPSAKSTLFAVLAQ